MVKYTELAHYKAVAAGTTLSEDGETGLITFLTPHNKNISVRLTRNALVRLKWQLTRLLADEAPTSEVPGKATESDV
jgi:hypothetical protein